MAPWKNVPGYVEGGASKKGSLKLKLWMGITARIVPVLRKLSVLTKVDSEPA